MMRHKVIALVRQTEKEKIVKMPKSMTVAAVAAVFLVSALLTCGNVQAAGGSIGVMYMNKVFAGSDAGKMARTEMDKKVEELQEKLKEDEAALRELQEEIQKKSSVWNDQKKQEKAIELQRMGRDYRAKQEDAQMELKKMEEEQLGPIRKQLEVVIEKVAKEKGLLMILPSEVVLYADDSIDVSDAITKALNEQTKK